MGDGQNSRPVVYFNDWAYNCNNELHTWSRVSKPEKTGIFTKCVRSIRSVLQRLSKNTKFA